MSLSALTPVQDLQDLWEESSIECRDREKVFKQCMIRFLVTSEGYTPVLPMSETMGSVR